MKGKIVRRIFSLCCATIFVLLLTGCNPTAGATQYEVIYPSGYSRDCFAYDEKSPIEGSSCCLKWKKSENQLKVAWTSYEPVGDEYWEYLEKKAYEIPITENANERAKSADEVM